jgi:type I restriction enzyme, S subunit
MELKPGYKQTEVGVIPEEWETKPLGEISIVAAGGTPSRGVPEYWNGGIPWVTTTEIDFCTISDTAQTISEAGLENSAAKLLEPGTLLLALYGQGKTRGKIAILGIQAATNQACASIALCSGVSRAYAYHYLSSRYDSIRGLSNSGSQENLNSAIVKSLPVALPPTKAEQETIAAVLSDADALIESLVQLIAKKRNLKQGAMQELLAGKKRLPGFSGEWKTRQLGELIAHCSSGATPYRGRPEYYKGSVKWISSGELNYNLITDTLEHISDEAVKKTNLKIHPVGTFLMAITGLEAAGTRGACAIVGSPATTNQSCMAIYTTPELKTEYLYHYYVLRGNQLALRYCQGTKQQSYTAKLVRLLPIDLPSSVEEQTAIASVLTDMDVDIAALEAKLAKARQLKKGMVQELLTGKTRLV